MEIDAAMRQKIVISLVAVGAFFALFIGIGVTYGPDLGQAGGVAIVGAIALFIVVMAGVGFVLDS